MDTVEKRTLRTFFIAVLVGLPLIGLKTWAYIEADYASSILASLLDSTVDMMISGMHGLALWYALQPADPCHRHGHGKMEALSALIQVLLLIGGGALLIYEAYDDFGHPPGSDNNTLVVILMIVSAALTFGLAKFQHSVMHHAHAHNQSLALEADHSHYWTDSLLYAGVLGALILNAQFGLYWVHSVVAAIAGIYMIKVGWGILQKSMDMLLDAEIEESKREKIKSLITSVKEIDKFHDLRCTRKGMKYDISFDVELPPEMSVGEAHGIIAKAENKIIKEFPHAEVMIHVDPIGKPEDSRHQDMKKFHRE